MPDPKCPIHNVFLEEHCSKWGTTWRCVIHGCTVRWWGSENTTPCDYETAKARNAAHDVVDAIWHRGRMKRADLYRKMKAELGIEHIGLCDIEQCRRVIEWAKGL